MLKKYMAYRCFATCCFGLLCVVEYNMLGEM